MKPIIRFIKVLKLLNINNHLIFLTIFNFIFSLLEILSLAMLIPLINFILNPEFFLNYLINNNFTLLKILGNYFSDLNQYQIIKSVILTLILVITVKFLYSLFFEWFKARFIYKIEFILSDILYTKYITSDYKYVLDRNSSELHRNILGDIGQFNGTAQSMVLFFTDLFFSLGILSLLLVTNFKVTLILIIVVGFLGYLIFKFTSRFNYFLGKQVSDATEKKIDIMLQSFGGIKEIIIYNSTNFFKNIFNIQNEKLSKAKQNNSIIVSLPKIFIEFIIFASFSFAILALFYLGLNTSNLFAQMSFLAIALIRIAPSFYRIVVSLQRLKFTEVPIDNIFLKLKDTQPFKEKKLSSNLISFEKIKFNNVSFNFKEKKIFSNLNLIINKNNLIGIHGESGVGKTTFINLITGLYFPSSGKILYDDLEILNSIEEWRNIVGFVPQNVFISNDTLKNNIAFGIKEYQIDNEKILKAIKLSGLNNFVESNSKGIEFILGENGSKLSGGQRQRVGIARALYKNSKLLIFDEATNSLDENTEKEVIKNIYNLKDKFTIIIISHNKKIIDQCDIIYKIENFNLYKDK